jgi:hypothetical protein
VCAILGRCWCLAQGSLALKCGFLLAELLQFAPLLVDHLVFA